MKSHIESIILLNEENDKKYVDFKEGVNIITGESIGKLTYDEKRENPFELTDVLGNGDMATRVSDMFTSNFSRNPKLGHAFLSGIKEYEDNGYKIGGYTYRKAVQYMNAYGGMTLVDYLEENEMKDIVIKKIKKILRDPQNTDSTAKRIFSEEKKKPNLK